MYMRCAFVPARLYTCADEHIACALVRYLAMRVRRLQPADLMRLPCTFEM